MSVEPAGDRSDEVMERATRLLETERAKIGHEIHDALLPLIFAASASVSNVIESRGDTSSEDVRQKLGQVVGWLNEAMQSGRRLLTEVYPPSFVGNHWTSAATDAIQQLLGPSADRVHWRLAAEVNEVSAPLAHAAYRIVVEAARNAVRHGNASQVTITGQRDTDGLTLVIHDNGTGFEPGSVPSDRFGIRSMRGRAELVGGRLEIVSQPGGPTCVTFTAPPGEGLAG